MTETELRARLQAVEPPGDPAAAQERAWRAVRAAHRAPAHAGGRRRRRALVPALACLLALAAGALASGRPQPEAVAHWLRSAIGLGAAPRARPLLAGLPSRGLLLVEASDGPWIVGADGSRRHLGRFAGAAWSPHTLYVVGWRGARLAVLDRRGAVQWSLGAAGPVSVARWSPDGYRIAYVAQGALWAVAGDGSADRRLRERVAPVAPAWQPDVGAAHRLAVVTAGGAIELLDADAGTRVWRARMPAVPQQLLWSADGRRLLAIAGRRLSLFDARGRLLAERTLAGTVVAAAAAHAGAAVALVLAHAGSVAGDVAVLTATPAGMRRAPEVLAGGRLPMAGVSWSPDDRWLIAADPADGSWILVRTAPGALPQAVRGVARLFAAPGGGGAGVPSPAGWQAVGLRAGG